MKNILILSILLYCCPFLCAQNTDIKLQEDKLEAIQLEIDSVNAILEEHELVIEKLADSQSTILKELNLLTIGDIENGKGIEVVAKVDNELGPFNLFDKPNGKVIKKFKVNSTITLLSQVDKYYKIRYKDTEGYISSTYIKLDAKTRTLFERLYNIEPYKAYSSPSTTRAKTASRARTSSGGSIHVKGHYRTLKSGKKVYVRPHTRKRH